MRVLSVKQPWADAIVHGPKRVENRTWMTAYRGPLAIHSSLVFDRPALGRPVDHPLQSYLQGAYGDVPDVRGAIIGTAALVGCHRAAADCGCDGWGERGYGITHLVLEDVRALAAPYRWRGALGIRDLPVSIALAIAAAPSLSRPR
jgi:hypothetical protein